MSEDRLLFIIARWKNEAHELSRQLEYTRTNHQEECFRLQQKLNQFQYENISLKNSIHPSIIENEDILKQLLRNVDASSISDQLSVLCDFFVHSLKTLLLSNIVEEKHRSTINCPPIVESIETNIKQIGNLIKKMNKDCSNQLIRN